MDAAIVTGIFTIIGAIVGACISYRFVKKIEYLRQKNEFKTLFLPFLAFVHDKWKHHRNIMGTHNYSEDDSLLCTYIDLYLENIKNDKDTFQKLNEHRNAWKTLQNKIKKPTGDGTLHGIDAYQTKDHADILQKIIDIVTK